MKRDEKKSFTPVPWDNLPRQSEANPHLPSLPSGKRSPSRRSVDPTFSNAHAFYPFQATLSNPEEEK
jgi:hypothetical protein